MQFVRTRLQAIPLSHKQQHRPVLRGRNRKTLHLVTSPRREPRRPPHQRDRLAREPVSRTGPNSNTGARNVRGTDEVWE